MLTREQRRQRRRDLIYWLITGAIIACLISTKALAAGFDPEQYKTGLSAVGAVAVGWIITKAAVWLDGGKR